MKKTKKDILPVMLQTLERAVNPLSGGYKREIPQQKKYATCDPCH